MLHGGRGGGRGMGRGVGGIPYMIAPLPAVNAPFGMWAYKFKQLHLQGKHDKHFETETRPIEPPSECEFLELPSLVVASILRYLDQTSLVSLRNTCRTAQSWVDNEPKCVKKIRIYLKDAHRQGQIQGSNVRWSNVVIPGTLCRETLTPILYKYGPSLKRVKITGELNPVNLSDMLFSHGPAQFETIVFSCLMTAKYEGAHAHYQHYQQIDQNQSQLLTLLLTPAWKAWKDVIAIKLAELRQLHFRKSFYCKRDILHWLVSEMLENCPKLEEITLPVIKYTMTPALGQEGILAQQCEPLITYLERINSMPRTSRSRPTLQRIDFGSILTKETQRGAVGTIQSLTDFHCVYPLTTTTLLRVLELCQPLGVKLYNVPLHAFTTEMSEDQEQAFISCVASVLCRNEGDLMRVRQCPNVFTSTIKIELALSIINPNLIRGLPLIPANLNLSSIYIQTNNLLFSGRVAFSPGRVYETVTTVAIECKDFPVFCIGEIFPNLKKLYLLGMGEKDYSEIDSILDHMINLTDLTFKNCELPVLYLPHADVSSIAFRKCQNLKRFRVIDCSMKYKPSPYRHQFPLMY